MRDFLILVAANLTSILAAEAITIRWLRKHKPHINKDHDIDV